MSRVVLPDATNVTDPSAPVGSTRMSTPTAGMPPTSIG
jgi:hypothetical protein